MSTLSTRLRQMAESYAILAKKMNDLVKDYDAERATLSDNAYWLSQAHALCNDLDVPQGHIENRLFEAISKVREMDDRLLACERDLEQANEARRKAQIEAQEAVQARVTGDKELRAKVADLLRRLEEQRNTAAEDIRALKEKGSV